MIQKTLYRGAASTSAATLLYTTPPKTRTEVKNIMVCNTSASAATFTLNFATVAANSSQSIDGNKTVYFDMAQMLAETETITGSASAITVNFHISGEEIV